MSDNHPKPSTASSSDATMGEVNHISLLSDNLSALYLNDNFSDITLIVDGHRLPAHRVLLAARSDYFRALLYGGMKESSESDIEIKVSSLQAFKYLLKYLYCGHIQLKSFKEETILEIFSLSHEYGFIELETAISDYLKNTLSMKNVFVIYDTAKLFQLNQLAEDCLILIDRRAPEVVRNELFYSLSIPTLKDIIKRDSFRAQQIDIFRAVCEWAKRNSSQCPEVVKEVISCIRLHLISNEDLLSVVRNSGLVDPNDILDVIDPSKNKSSRPRVIWNQRGLSRFIQTNWTSRGHPYIRSNP